MSVSETSMSLPKIQRYKNVPYMYILLFLKTH